MFTILTTTMKLANNEMMTSHTVHLQSEVKIAFAKRLNDSRVTFVDFTSHHETLEDAQIAQRKLRSDK